MHVTRCLAECWCHAAPEPLPPQPWARPLLSGEEWWLNQHCCVAPAVLCCAATHTLSVCPSTFTSCATLSSLSWYCAVVILKLACSACSHMMLRLTHAPMPAQQRQHHQGSKAWPPCSNSTPAKGVGPPDRSNPGCWCCRRYCCSPGRFLRTKDMSYCLPYLLINNCRISCRTACKAVPHAQREVSMLCQVAVGRLAGVQKRGENNPALSEGPARQGAARLNAAHMRSSAAAAARHMGQASSMQHAGAVGSGGQPCGCHCYLRQPLGSTALAHAPGPAHLALSQLTNPPLLSRAAASPLHPYWSPTPLSWLLSV